MSFLRTLGAERIVAAVNAGERPAAVELPDGQRLRLEPMEGKLLRWEEERLTELLGT